MKLKSLNTKIILSTVSCILIVGFFSYSFLYGYLADMVSEKARRIETLTLQTVRRLLNDGLEKLHTLGNNVSNEYDVARGILHRDITSLKAKQDLLRAQEVMSYYWRSSGVGNYVDKMLAFNEEGIMVQVSGKRSGRYDDFRNVQNLDLYEEFMQSGQNSMIAISPSITQGEGDVIALIGFVDYYALPYAPGLQMGQGWIYAELSLQYMWDILRPYAGNGLFVAQVEGEQHVLAYSEELPKKLLAMSWESFEPGKQLEVDGVLYRMNTAQLSRAGLWLYSGADITIFAGENTQITVTVIVVALTAIVAVLLLAVLLVTFINRPLKRLRARIERISQNDFSYDPEIERSGDEIAEVGKVVNEMNLSIAHLLRETEEMYEQRKDAEIALLQSQVNPHFLYNTLDSIRWMAVIQKNPGIEKTARSLANLLKNLAKGVGDKITLEEEIGLLLDYTETQSIRFMEVFEVEVRIIPALYEYRIVKFTLQPLVENAIFHGIEPSEGCGTIWVDAREDGEYLLITVEDNGVGMDEEELNALMKMAQNPHPSGMAGIGVANVNHRLKLIYGPECGLSYESEKGRFTRVTVRIKKEADIGENI